MSTELAHIDVYVGQVNHGRSRRPSNVYVGQVNRGRSCRPSHAVLRRANARSSKTDYFAALAVCLAAVVISLHIVQSFSLCPSELLSVELRQHFRNTW